MTLKLNIGAGDKPLDGYVNIDRKTGGEAYPLLRDKGLPFDDGVANEVRASHVLEHFPHGKTIEVLREWVRVLKPGGALKVAVPDFDKCVDWYLNGHDDLPLEGFIMGGQVDGDDHHHAIFNRAKLEAVMREAGLVDIREWTSEINDCANLPVSLNLMGTKLTGNTPAANATSKQLKVAAVMSVPRLGFMDNFFSWANALAPLGINPTKVTGAFWGQCLERGMEGHLDADYILTIDYDSIFTKQHVEELLRLAATHPEADAIAPIQLKRDTHEAMAVAYDKDGKATTELELSGELTPVITAHFGLTLIKVDALKKLRKPWFMGVPRKDGTWGDGRVDDDIYFWRNLYNAGGKLFLANKVCIGHAELMVTWMGADGKPIYQSPGEFWKSGAPNGVFA